MKQSLYNMLRDKLKDLRCNNCYGTGRVDDSSPGDISFNEYVCSECDGTGVQKEYQEVIAHIAEDMKLS